jgi:putative transposase
LAQDSGTLAAAAASAEVGQRLSDAPRCGAPATFTPEQICQIMAMACEDPERLDVPISQWTQSELARQAVSRGIVESISHGSVGHFFKKGASLKPHLIR